MFRILVEHLGTQIYLEIEQRGQAPSRPSLVHNMSFEMTTCHLVKQAENCRFLSLTVLICRQHGTCQLQAQSNGTKKKPTALRLWVFVLVVVAGFEPATSAL